MPFVRFRHVTSYPKDQECRNDPDQKYVTVVRLSFEDPHFRELRYARDSNACEQHTYVYTCLENRGDPGTPAFGPCFRKQARPHGPLSANPESRQKPADQKLPPGLNKKGAARKCRIGQTG